MWSELSTSNFVNNTQSNSIPGTGITKSLSDDSKEKDTSTNNKHVDEKSQEETKNDPDYANKLKILEYYDEYLQCMCYLLLF